MQPSIHLSGGRTNHGMHVNKQSRCATLATVFFLLLVPITPSAKGEIIGSAATGIAEKLAYQAELLLCYHVMGTPNPYKQAQHTARRKIAKSRCPHHIYIDRNRWRVNLAHPAYRGNPRPIRIGMFVMNRNSTHQHKAEP